MNPVTKPNSSQEKRNQLFIVVGSIAAGLKNSILYLLLSGVAASTYLAWKWIDFSTHFSWIIIKALPLFIPVLLWGFLYSIITELADLPNMTKTAKQDGEAVVKRIQLGREASEKTMGFFAKIKRLFSVLRGAGNLASIVGAVSGAALVANPLSMLVFLIVGLVLMLLIFIALLILIF